MREAFVLLELLTFLNKVYWRILDISLSKFNETLTNDVVNFDQLDPDCKPCIFAFAFLTFGVIIGLALFYPVLSSERITFF